MAINIDGDGLIALGGTSTTQGRLRLAEDTDNGTNYIELTAPASVASDRTITFPDATGTVVISGTTPSLNGITFPATQVASADANTLDDYEEGTFTPVYAPSSGSFTSVTYESQSGNYVKIGRVVFYNLIIGTDAITVGGASGQILIHGFPFTVSGTNQAGPSTFAGRSSNFAGEEPFAFTLFTGDTKGELYYKNAVDGNIINLVVADLDTGADSNRLIMNGFYYA